jgi:predicted nucleic-acid-binding protein
MLAIDTNIIVRFLTRDDERQAARSLNIIEGNRIWISKTVLLETYWVLKSRYGFSAVQAVNGLKAMSAHRNAYLEHAEGVHKALALFDQGIDFADALHLASAAGASQFSTFDQKLVRRSQKAGLVTVVSA